MSLPPPADATISQDLDTLRIALPARKETSQVPVQPAENTILTTSPWRVLAALLIYPSILASMVYLLSWSTVVEILTRLPLWLYLMNIATITMIIAAAVHVSRTPHAGEGEAPLQTVSRTLPAAAVELRPHHLTIRSRSSTETIPLGDIDAVTVDKAGARLRVQGRMRYLLPERTDTERAWLAELVQAAVQTRQAGTVNSDAARVQLQKLLKQT